MLHGRGSWKIESLYPIFLGKGMVSSGRFKRKVPNVMKWAKQAGRAGSQAGVMTAHNNPASCPFVVSFTSAIVMVIRGVCV